MFFDYMVYVKNGSELIDLSGAKVNVYQTENKFISEYVNEIKNLPKGSDARQKCESISLMLGIPSDIKAKINELSKDKYVYNDEAYYIEIGEKTIIYGETERAAIHALSTVKRLAFENELYSAVIFDYPAIAYRGYHSFIPNRKQMKDFKGIINNLLVYYKFNSITFEVGGAMEYKKHPRINKEWVKYCDELLADSGIADKIQHHTFPWAKTAIHPENGKGSYITQDEMRELIAYCRERGLDVIPEVPSLSHADYIVRAYPEINERADDPYPDHYCPSNPKSYEIMYDILDEVADVFEGTKYISIGHDELVTFCVCDKCKDKDPAKLFAEDITKLHDHISKKGLKTLMYGDKFAKFYKDGLTCEEANGEGNIDDWGKPRGGLAGYTKGDIRYVPAVYQAYDMIPRDIIILDWYWSYNQFDELYTKHEVFLANFSSAGLNKWERIFGKNIKGAMQSNWGPNDYNNMQRNNIFYSMIYNAYTFWSDRYCDELKNETCDKVLRELNAYYKNFELKYDTNKKYINVCHATDHFMPFRWFYDGDFVKEEEYRLGDYEVVYTDGTSYKEPVIYGKNIASINLDLAKNPSEIKNVSGASVAEAFGEDMYYNFMFENKYADKEIKDIRFVPSGYFPDAKVYTNKIEY